MSLCHPLPVLSILHLTASRLHPSLAPGTYTQLEHEIFTIAYSTETPMSPLRKRPKCQKCGGLMAGHKRPNGIPTCPIDKVVEPMVAHPPLCREPVVVPPVTPGGVYHYRNPNWEEPDTDAFPYTGSPCPRSDTPYSWAPTEPADDIPYIKEETDVISVLRDRQEIELLQGPPSVASASAAVGSLSSSRIRRSFSSLLTNGVPLLSLFSTPKEDIQTITQAARRNGLHTGVLRRPGLDIVKEEHDETPSAVRRRKAWWVVLGTDPEAVEHLMDLQERDTIARLEAVHGEIPLQRAHLHQAQSHKPFQFSILGIIGLIILVTFTGVFAAVVFLSFV